MIGEKVVAALRDSGMEYRIVRPCGYFSDMGVLLDMAQRGRSFLVGEGANLMNPIRPPKYRPGDEIEWREGRQILRLCSQNSDRRS